MKQITTFVLIITLGLTSCLKDSEEFSPNIEVGDINALLEKLDDFDNTIAINPGMDNTIVTNSNEVIFIPANTVKNEDNTSAEGTVFLSYAVIKSRAKDIVKNRETKVGNDNSAALYNVQVSLSQGTKKMIVGNESNGISFKIPYNTSENQPQPYLYKWSENKWNIESNTHVINKNWKLETNNGTIFGIGYETIIKSTGDFMVAVPTTSSGELELCLNLPENYTEKNTTVFALFPEENMSYRLKYENGKFCGKNLPAGQVVKLISLSDQNGKYFITENKHRLTKSFNISAVPKAKTISEIKEWLQTL
jgi:hypothetical protein